ncbi:MAG: rod shape-determining protein MreC [Bdellovibrionales bacterium]
MNFFNFDLKKIIIIALLVAIPLLSINMQQRAKDQPWILSPFYYLAGKTQSAYASFSSGVRSTTGLYLNLIDIKKDNARLSKELAEYKAQLGSMTELKLENQRLGGLLDFKQKSNMNLLATRIIGRDLLVDYNTVTIDRGALHGVKKGMGTLTISGVVGYIIEVEEQTSKILLITDRYAVVDGIVQRSRANGIVQGHTDTCALSFLKRSDDVQVGDVVVTSGIDNYFPKGFPIGTVTSVVKDQYGLGQEASMQPVVNAANLEEVFIVLNANNVDFEANKEESKKE